MVATEAKGRRSGAAVKRPRNSSLAKVPAAICRGLLAMLPVEQAFDALQVSGRKCGVSEIRVVGNYGPIEGSIEDSAILRSYAATGSWRPTENRFFQRIFDAPRKGTFIDVGANIGLTTIPIARIPGVACKLFEPEPKNFRYLKSNISVNCPGANVELFNFALFDQSGTVDLQVSRRNMGDHRIRSSVDQTMLDVKPSGHTRVQSGTDAGDFEVKGRTVIQVAAKRLDDVLDAHHLVDPVAVKISVQGAESHVIAGAQTVLRRAVAMVIEFYPALLRRMGADPEILISFSTDQFNAGALMRGGEERDPDWQPMEALAPKLRNLMLQGVSGQFDYYRLLLMRRSVNA